jgi:hypothetical protein
MPAAMDWLRPLNPPDRRRTRADGDVPGRRMTDSPAFGIRSCRRLLRTLSQRMGRTCRSTAGAATSGWMGWPHGRNST